MKKVDLSGVSAYEIVKERNITDLDSYGYILRHKKTGAKVVLLANEDDNKVFYIGFRTPPEDSTGLPHILEHSVLCGSREFPVKDPFVELAKGSLNTFLNAMTYPDKTVYPVASCNDKDFQNLIHVYLDAVFYPNIYKEPKIFRQEGWHYEMEDEDDALTLNGVVYNEMKGAFSSPDDMLDREILNSLFPDTAYGVESGGDPECIPNLTYEDFIAFHGRYYHPSNSYIYLYGNMDMAEKLNWIDAHYLADFDALSIDSSIAEQAAFQKEVEVVREYPVTGNDPIENNTFLSYNVVIENSLDRELYIAFQVLDYALCSAPGAPLKQALIDKGIGKDVYSSYENGIRQPYFSVISKNADYEQKEEFLSTIREVLENLVQEGIDRNALKAGINYFEFRYKEADFGSYPKGLMYGLQSLDSWLYDEEAPFCHIEANATYKYLKNMLETDYFEKLVEKYLLNNTHKSVVSLIPVRGLTAKKDRDLEEKLAQKKASFSADDIKRLVSETSELKEYQETESSPEDMEKIPLLTRGDLKKEAEPFINELREIDGTKVLFHEIYTNGVSYLKFIFKMDQIKEELLPYVGLLKSVLGYVDTRNYGYGDLFNQINILTGGIDAGTGLYVNHKNPDELTTTFEIKTKVLYENTAEAYRLIQEILFTSKLDDSKRLLEIIEELKSRMQASMTSAGHSTAALRALAYFSEGAAVSEKISGIPFLRKVEEWNRDFEGNKEEIITNLRKVMRILFRPENLMVDYTGTTEGLVSAEAGIQKFRAGLFTDAVETGILKVCPRQLNEGFKTSGQVQYVCRAGNFRKEGLVYTGALKILKVIMGYEYLWVNVRVKGGAYGCMSSFGRTGDCYFVSYRDPNLEKTIEIFEHAAEFVEQFQSDERTLTKYIIGAVSDLDVPLNAAAKGSRSLAAYLSNVALEDEQKDRDELLQAEESTIRSLAVYIRAFMGQQAVCAVGNEEKINGSAEIFAVTEHLFQ